MDRTGVENWLDKNNEVVSMEGCPIEVGGNFNCSRNKLSSLDDCPSGQPFNEFKKQ